MPATLSLLRIRNLALVEDLEWQLAPGFTAITGETGAGKSIIIGALQLLLGDRTDKSLIRTGAESCTVEAAFAGQELKQLASLLDESGIESTEDELIVKRSFSTAGTNRQFINGSPTTLGILKRLGDELVDLHGPHDHQSLLSPERQLALLDGYAHNAETLRSFSEAYRRLQSLRAEHASLSTAESAREQEIDLLRHQINEITGANLATGEEEEISSRYRLASNSKRLLELAAAISRRLSEADDAILPQLAETQRLLRDLEKIDPDKSALADAHAACVVELSEISRVVAQYAEQLDLDPAQLAALEERVTLFETLKRKYGGSIPEVIAFGEGAAERMRKIEGRDAELERLNQEIEGARGEVERIGHALHKARSKAAPKLAENIRANLRDLGFRQSEFEVQLAALEEARPAGFDSVELLFSPNPGEPAKPLRLIASSGEISRLMLAIKSSLAAQDAIPLLVFDEIDANVGGEIANAVGEKMRKLAAEHQVLCITHLPQVAAAAATQFVVTKEVVGGRTHSRLSEVSGKARQEEIARMLGGKTDSALKHAATLLKR
ncbi:MAG TPA: DNA repair protein RecN [Chthoniobacterales bacterium]|jgi:DNA repair protein RecN (Recombination protein N)|nr:DNA repair protein RecN [Chthoniobacterales bacterium]